MRICREQGRKDKVGPCVGQSSQKAAEFEVLHPGATCWSPPPWRPISSTHFPDTLDSAPIPPAGPQTLYSCLSLEQGNTQCLRRRWRFCRSLAASEKRPDPSTGLGVGEAENEASVRCLCRVFAVRQVLCETHRHFLCTIGFNPQATRRGGMCLLSSS